MRKSKRVCKKKRTNADQRGEEELEERERRCANERGDSVVVNSEYNLLQSLCFRLKLGYIRDLVLFHR
jgi:hypothetical protein